MGARNHLAFGTPQASSVSLYYEVSGESRVVTIEHLNLGYD